MHGAEAAVGNPTQSLLKVTKQNDDLDVHPQTESRTMMESRIILMMMMIVLIILIMTEMRPGTLQKRDKR